MKTLTFTDEEIELLCLGVLALQDQEADLGPLIALHAKLTGHGRRYFIEASRRSGKNAALADLDDVHLASMVEQGMPVSDYVAEKKRRGVV